MMQNARMQEAGDPVAAGLDRYVRFLGSLTADSLDRLDDLVTEGVHFRDPFNDVRGRGMMKAVFADMFRDCTDIAFVTDGIVRQDREAFLKWTFRFHPRRFGGPAPWIATGVSELQLATDGRIAVHIDHWDAGSQFYARLPVVGPLVRFVRSRVQHH